LIVQDVIPLIKTLVIQEFLLSKASKIVVFVVLNSRKEHQTS